MRVSVEIRGDGVAARCCAHLFAKSRIPVVWQPCERPRLPAILLSEPAQALISDVFGRKDLFAGLPAIRKRIVCWGRGASPVALDHSAVVVSEEVLLQRLQAAMPAKAPVRDRPAGWTIHASRPLPDSASEHRFGSRMATATRVELKPTTEPPACWIESVEDGWLFLIEDAPRAGWLLSVGSNSEKLLGKSRLIGEQAAACGPAGAPFDASPRIVSPLGEPGWLACGTAAMAFDPICGDGTAHAVREAILATAAIGAVARGEDAGQLVAHYQSRLLAGFRRHLAQCLEYYASGNAGPWWEAEAQAVSRGLDWCDRQSGRHAKFRYRLQGFDLFAIPEP